MESRRADWPTPEEKLAALHDKLTAAVEELASSEAWMRMLQVAARFPTYSPSNVILIGLQRADATQVAGFRTWASLGRHVLKGEHGIAILAPCLYREKTSRPEANSAETMNQAATEHGLDAPQSPDSEGVRQLRGFRVVHVFDLSQTDGEPLPDVAPELLQGPAPEDLWNRLARLVTEDGYVLERGDCGGANGYTNYTDRTVRVRDDVDPAQSVKTLAHEIGHIRARHQERFPDYSSSLACRGVAEVEAESIAFLVTAMAGMEAGNYSVPYVANWSGGDPQVLRNTATRVLTTARTIGTALGFGDSGSTIPNAAPSEAVVREPSRSSLGSMANRPHVSVVPDTGDAWRGEAIGRS